MPPTDTTNPVPVRAPLRRPVIQYAPQEEKRERIKVWMGASMVLTAVFLDSFNALLNFLVVGEFFSSIISAVATFGFVVWFWILGVGFAKSPKKLAAMAGQAIVGLVPLVNTLPELIIGVLITILLTRAEDKGGILGKAASLAS